MEKQTLAIRFELPQKISTNEIYSGKHWMSRKRHKDIFLWAFLDVVGKIPNYESCDIEFDFEFKGRLLDCDNCVYMCKLIIDCLRHYGKIKDDTPDVVRSIKITSSKGEKDAVILKICGKKI